MQEEGIFGALVGWLRKCRKLKIVSYLFGMREKEHIHYVQSLAFISI